MRNKDKSETAPPWGPYRALCIAFAFCCITGGCGDGLDLQEVSGRVTLAGQPVAEAAVLFEPVDGGPVANGLTNTDGAFQLKTVNLPGVPLGNYRVAISKNIMHGIREDGSTDPGGVRTQWITPQRYALPKRSGLSADVVDGKNEFVFELTLN